MQISYRVLYTHTIRRAAGNTLFVCLLLSHTQIGSYALPWLYPAMYNISSSSLMTSAIMSGLERFTEARVRRVSFLDPSTFPVKILTI